MLVGAALLFLIGGLSFLAVRRQPAPETVQISSDPHADHMPRHGGVVLMNGDTHFEVVATPAGRYEVYFSNAVRMPLPPTAVVSVVITILRTKEPPEGLELHADQGCQCWTATGTPVTDPAAVVRVAYMADEPFMIDVPVSGWPPRPSP